MANDAGILNPPLNQSSENVCDDYQASTRQLKADLAYLIQCDLESQVREPMLFSFLPLVTQ
jgi:hypothetical protein